jgi:6-phosphogluconolactonase
MKTEVLADARSVATRAAGIIARQARECFAARRRFVMAVSGGSTVRTMLRMLGQEEIPWGGVYVVQGHERIGATGNRDTNLPDVRKALMEDTPINPKNIYPMPVHLSDANAAAEQYAASLQSLCGNPPVIDLVQLELFSSGRTAALLPGDPVLEVTNRDVAVTEVHEQRRRMTLTYPALNRSRQILWIVTGSEKQKALAQLRAGDLAIPASRVSRDHALLLTDHAAAGEFPVIM